MKKKNPPHTQIFLFFFFFSMQLFSVVATMFLIFFPQKVEKTTLKSCS